MTLEDKAKEIGIDWDTSVKRFCGNKQLYEEFLKRFPKDKYFPELQRAWNERNVEKTERSAHALKGMCANLGINDLAQKFGIIVQAMRSEDAAAGFDDEEIMQDCEREYKRIWNALKELG